MNPVKNVLIYADGHTEELDVVLAGTRFVKLEKLDDAWWERIFEIDVVYSGHDPETYSMIGKERALVRSTIVGDFAPTSKVEAK